jgi:gluconokinase
VIFEWFTKQFGDFKIPYEIDYSMENLIHEASKISVGSEGLLFLPYLLGERAPIWNANARGSYFGLNIKHERQHFIRATIEGILYEIYSIGKTMEEHRAISSLSVNGSVASIPFCSQMIADIFNKPVNIRKNSDSIALGSFLLSSIEMGKYKTLEEAARTVELPDRYAPNATNHATYSKYAEIFGRLTKKLAEEFQDIARLQQKTVD